MVSILLVDDASYMRKLVKLMLSKEGYDVVGEASTGYDAIEMFKKFSPDLVIMDIVMPDMDGIETLKVIKEIDSGAKVLMCTASEQAHHIYDATEAGAIGYIVKPFDRDALISKVKEVL